MPRAIRSRPHCSLGEPLPDRPVNPWLLGFGPLVLAGLLGYQSWQLWRSQLPSSWLKAIEELIETLLVLGPEFISWDHGSGYPLPCGGGWWHCLLV